MQNRAGHNSGSGVEPCAEMILNLGGGGNITGVDIVTAGVETENPGCAGIKNSKTNSKSNLTLIRTS
jgi:hypothetical protein